MRDLDANLIIANASAQRLRRSHPHHPQRLLPAKARAYAESLIKNAPDPVFVSDLQGKIL